MTDRSTCIFNTECASLVPMLCNQAVNANLITAADGYLKTFFDKTKEMTPEERGKYLEEDEVSGIHTLVQ